MSSIIAGSGDLEVVEFEDGFAPIIEVGKLDGLFDGVDRREQLISDVSHVAVSVE